MEEDEEEGSVKVVLIGETGVGKTCIISRYINNIFEDNVKTNCASFSSKTLTFPEYKNKTIKFEIWDTAGQEKYRALNKVFYKDAAICILVYDVTNKDSFNALKDYYCKQIRDICSKDIIVGIAGNKCDLLENEVISEEEGRNFAKEMNAVFERTSASQNIGIEDLFHNLGCKYIDANFKDINETEPKDDKENQKGKIYKLNGKKIKEDDDKKKKCC